MDGRRRKRRTWTRRYRTGKALQNADAIGRAEPYRTRVGGRNLFPKTKSEGKGSKKKAYIQIKKQKRLAYVQFFYYFCSRFNMREYALAFAFGKWIA